MTKIRRTELIKLARDYIELPMNETTIVFRQNPGSCELSFYKTIKEITPNSYTEYHYTITYTDFMGNKRLRIDAYQTKDRTQKWYKEIDL